jgi:hypothetical protein
MDMKNALMLLVQDHLEEQKTDPQMLRLSEIITMLNGSPGAELHEEMWPEDVVLLILTRLEERGILDQAKSYFEKLDERTLLEETSLYGIMVDLGATDWK